MYRAIETWLLSLHTWSMLNGLLRRPTQARLGLAAETQVDPPGAAPAPSRVDDYAEG